MATASPWRLQGVAEGVAQVEQGALAGLTLIFGDDGGLGLAALQHGLAPRRGVPLDHGGTVLFQPGEEGGIVDQAVLGHLGIAG